MLEVINDSRCRRFATAERLSGKIFFRSLTHKFPSFHPVAHHRDFSAMGTFL